MTGDFLKMYKKNIFYGGLGDVATRKLVGPPEGPMYFVRLIFPDLFIFSSQSLTEDFSNIEPTFSI